MNSVNPADAIDLIELIQIGKSEEINYSTTSYTIRIGNNIRPTSNMVDRYMDFIMQASTLVRLSDDEYRKYKFRPKILSQDLYQTPELWFILLKINRCQSASKFNFNKLKVLNPKNIKIINDIFIINEDKSILYKKESYK